MEDVLEALQAEVMVAGIEDLGDMEVQIKDVVAGRTFPDIILHGYGMFRNKIKRELVLLTNTLILKIYIFNFANQNLLILQFVSFLFKFITLENIFSKDY